MKENAMEKILMDLLDNIPDYQEFLTLEDMDESSKALAKAHPECVELFVMGKSREGRDILGLKIGNGSKNALFFGCPHPNEPIGTMLLEYFSKALAEDEALRKTLDYTFYLVKAWDADGYAMNEGWIKGPYTLYNYSRNFYRPVACLQVDWTFPIDYKELHFHDVMPETQAMMELIDRIKPTFTYALHNAGFGGVYWYVTEDVKEVYPSLYEAPKRQGVPLHLGEPESPSLTVLAPAITLATGIEEEYDYYEKYGAKDIASIIENGTCSDSYSKEKYGTFTFLTEMPYFYDARITDTSPSKKTRGEAVLESIAWTLESNRRVREILDIAGKYMHKDNLFMRVVTEYTDGKEIETRKRMAEEDEEYQNIATVAEYFDTVTVSEFYRLLAYGMLVRAHEAELASEKDPAAIAALKEGKAKAEALHGELANQLENEFDYSVIPIKKLATIQLECGLKMAKYIHDR